MTFEEALIGMKKNIPMYRIGWNGKGLFTSVQYPDAGSVNTKPYLVMNVIPGDRVPWIPSQTDIFANDWTTFIIGDVASN